MALPLGLTTTKVIGIHLNYRSRADERGRTPTHPSYFLKPPSSLAADGDPVVRPKGCELLAYEGEVAVVIGERARNLAPEQAASHIGWYAASNDFGVYDMRWADRGSNLMAKGQDGFTPIGPRLVPGSELDGENLVLRTYVNGDVVQEDSTANLIFTFADLITDLSRFVTLEPGDVILTGTPRNSRPVEPGDVVEVEVEGVGKIRNEVVEGDELAPYGAMPKVTPEVRAAALGANTSRPAVMSEQTKTALQEVSTATLTVQLRKRGINDTFMRGLRPARPDKRMVGYAHTLRYVALREDVRDADTAPLNQQRQAVESIGQDEVLVMEARGEDRAGTIGDIMATRLLRRGAAGIVTDGAVRDSAAIADIGIPMYFKAPHAGVFGLIHYPLERNVPVTCAGILVMPGDVIVGDAEGALVIPAAMAEEVARDALEQEEREAFALERVDAGESLPEVYPLPDARRGEFDEWRSRRQQ